ncbi:MAG: rhodanese-related sulfurtransferase [Rubripirellula sp.]|nr:rhodanese-related sulfurtransferase [Rubripirellula sp.]
MPQFVVAALYRFTPLDDYAALMEPIESTMARLGVKGSLLLAKEGINGTIAADREGIDGILAYLRQDDRLSALDVKESYCDEMPFKRARVRLKKEIVTMGVEGIDPLKTVGTYVDPKDWNTLLNDPDVTLVDTRNDYEYAIGTFKGAMNPETHTFREFPKYVENNLNPEKHRKVAMFCTGGIRCEKSTALLKGMGFNEVYHLRGGILKYLEEVDPSESLWEGDCFVFDGRVSVGHGLEEGEHIMCFGCGWPVTKEQQQSERFIAGVQCPQCADTITDQQRSRFAERQRQHEQSKTTNQAE